MTFLLDTHVLLWWSFAGGADRLSKRARELLESADSTPVVSATVVWEISVKRALGKLDAPSNLVHILEHAGVPTLPIAAQHAELAAELPPHHKDPFDRLLIAQSQLEALPILTADKMIARYDVETIWS